jgi:hypothetical protein
MLHFLRPLAALRLRRTTQLEHRSAILKVSVSAIRSVAAAKIGHTVQIPGGDSQGLKNRRSWILGSRAGEAAYSSSSSRLVMKCIAAET